MSDLTLLTPTTLGSIELPNRVVMAPLTRDRADDHRAVGELQVEYYTQRAAAGLIISEATHIAPTAVGNYGNTPGIWSQGQVAGWRSVTDAVHAAGGRMICQLWHCGRVSHVDVQPGGAAPLSSTDRPTGLEVRVPGHDGKVPTSTPRRLRADELPGLVEQYVTATRNARSAGFDGVEVHAANGYLLEQFLAADVNDRDDAYGGSPENRARLLLEVLDAVIAEWEPGRVGLRLSLGNGTFNATDPDPEPVLRIVAEHLSGRGFAYVHLIEQFVRDAAGAEAYEDDPRTELLRELAGTPMMVNGGYDRATGESALRLGHADVVAYGKPYIPNPDLVERFAAGAALAAWSPETFYGGGREGYTDFPTMASG